MKKCRRDGCDNTLTSDDEAKGWEHCSSECYEANDDLDDYDYDEKNASEEDE